MKWKWGSGTSRQVWTSLNKTVHDEAHLSGRSNSRWVSSAQSSHKLPSVCHAACSCCHLLHIGLPRSALSSHSFIDVMKFLDVYIVDKFREIPRLWLWTIIHVDKHCCSISCLIICFLSFFCNCHLLNDWKKKSPFITTYHFHSNIIFNLADLEYCDCTFGAGASRIPLIWFRFCP